MDPASDQRIAHYQVLAKIGEGGMGAVYKARDTRLNRIVALKMLSARNEQSELRNRRLLQEAQTASALNHPNIVTIYEIGTENGASYIAMEFVDGETLGERIKRKPLSAKAAIPVALQIASALAAAHESGLVHRDLKPGNVMLTGTGMVKVLDFGLAKIAHPSTESADLTMTETQLPSLDEAIVGTVSYMSPEQTEGRNVDARTDIFAFGCVLYEMVTGRKAFDERSSAATMAAILREHPKPASAMAPDIPADFDRIIEWCLRKDAARRMQHMADVKVLLENIDFEPAVTVAAPKRNVVLPWAAAAVMAIAVAALWWKLMHPYTPPAEIWKMTQLTRTGGVKLDPVVSRDGKLVAYAANLGERSKFDIFVQQVNSGAVLQLTSDEVSEVNPFFSPDGSRVLFERLGQGIFEVSAFGGDARMIEPGARRPRYSPDGKWLSYDTGDTSPQACVREVGGGEEIKLGDGLDTSHNVAFSPDGKYILFYGRKKGVAEYYLKQLPAGQAMPLGWRAVEKKFQSGRPPLIQSWLDADSMLVLGDMDDARSLYRVPIELVKPALGSRLERLTVGAAHIESAEAVGDTIVFGAGTNLTSLGTVPFDAAAGRTTGMPKLLLADEVRRQYPTASGDGKMLAYSAERNSRYEILTYDAASGKERVIASGDYDSFYASLSPDGTQVAYGWIIDPRSKRQYWVSPSSGGQPRLLLDQSETSRLRGFTADGKSLLLWTTIPGKSIQLLNVADKTLTTVAGEPKTLLAAPRLSPDGKWLLFFTRKQTEWKAFVAPFHGAATMPKQEWVELATFQAPDMTAAWTPDSSRILYLHTPVSGSDSRFLLIQKLDAAKRPVGAPVQLAEYSGELVPAADSMRNPFVVLKDKLVTVLRSSRSQVWMMRRTALQ